MERVVKEILRKENIEYEKITKATSGFTNVVYFVDDIVVKMTNDDKIKRKLKKEILIYKNIELENIPQYISSGEFEEWQYIIISKVSGKSLYSIWHTLSQEERKTIVCQIANILKSFHGQNGEFLSAEDKTTDWLEFIINELTVKSALLKEMGMKTDAIDAFIKNEIPVLFSENEYSLIYNDAHFDNFLYDNGKVNLIDFDRVRYCAKDYEMLIFKTMCDNPSKFASEEDENNIKVEDYQEIYSQFKQNYPELFADEKIERRIKVYQFNYLLGQAIRCKDEKWVLQLLAEYKNT